MNVGAASLLQTRKPYFDIDSWYLSTACDAVEDESDLCPNLNDLSMTKNMAYHHGITQADDEDKKYLAATMCLQALSSLATSMALVRIFPQEALIVFSSIIGLETTATTNALVV
jgi:hypothetical protein